MLLLMLQLEQVLEDISLADLVVELVLVHSCLNHLDELLGLASGSAHRQRDEATCFEGVTNLCELVPVQRLEHVARAETFDVVCESFV